MESSRFPEELSERLTNAGVVEGKGEISHRAGTWSLMRDSVISVRKPGTVVDALFALPRSSVS